MKHVAYLALALTTSACASTGKAPFEYVELRTIEKDWGYTQAVKVGKTIYLSGSVSMDDAGKLLATGDMAGQLKNALADVQKTLARYGASPGHIVKETIFTTDIEALIAAYDVRAQFYKGHRFPPSSWVGVSRLGVPGTLVEVEVIAVVD
jgi:2-iminobutanoate/2-iminopropanoate deaminase